MPSVDPALPTSDAPAQPPQPATPGIGANLDATLSSAPELAHDPGTAIAVASSGGNVALKAQSVAHIGNLTANASAQDRVKASGGIFDEIGKVAGSALSSVAHIANVGLATVQQEYRYLHDVEARHGLMAALGEGAGILAGGVAGGMVGGFEGAVLGSEGVARLEGAMFYKDSWAAAANPNYRDPHTGQLVSFGRDVASAVGAKGGERTAISGALDGLGDIIADPVALGGKMLGAAHSLEGMSGALGNTFKGTAITAENVDQAYRTLPSVQRAFGDIAISSPGDIVRKYPQFAGIAGSLGDAKTADQVAETFKDLAASSEMLDAQRLPTLSLSRLPFRPLRDAARNAGDGSISQLPVVGKFISNHIANNVLIGPRTWADRLEAVPGTNLDIHSMDISGSQINPANTRGLRDIYNMVRYSGNDRVARSVVDAYSAGTPAQRIVITKNATMKMLFALAHQPIPEGELLDPNFANAALELVDGRTKKAILERLENHLASANIEGSPTGRIFGTGPDGMNVKPVMGPDGEVQGAISKNQTGNISLPNITEARRMAQAIHSSRASKILAGTDDFLYDHVTQGFFKPLVLMSGGYGLHIALAEAIPNTLRHGLTLTSKGMYNRAVATLGYKASADELGPLSGYLWRMGGAGAYKNSQEAQWLTDAYIAQGGYKTTTGLGAGEITKGETQPVEKSINGFRQKMGVGTREGSDFGLYGNETKRFPKLWQADLREQARDPWHQTAAKAYRDARKNGATEKTATEFARREVAKVIEAEPQDVKDNFVRMQYPMSGAPKSWTPIDGHAAAVVDRVKGIVHGRSTTPGEAGHLHDDLLASIANGHVPELHDLEAIDQSLRPMMVKGRQIVPDGTGTIQRIANFGFSKILNPMVNMISRNEEYAVEYVASRKALQPQVEAGLMSEDEALVRAQAQATTHSMRFVHNLHDRTQWTATMRNWAPFYFAQEQAYRRMGRLLAEDPGAFRRYQMMISGVHNLAVNMQDSTGNKYIAFPGSGFLGKGVADMMGMSALSVGGVAPAAYGGSFSSANVIFPMSNGIKPDLGPLVLVPAAQLSTMFTELNQTYGSHNPVLSVAANDLAAVAGSQVMSQPLWEQIIPNAFAQRIIQTVGGNDRAFNSSVMQAYQFADYQQSMAEEKWNKGGQKGPEPHIIPAANASAMEKQQFQDKIRNYTRMLYLVRAVTGFISPISSSVEMQNLNIPAHLQEYITKAGSVSMGMQQAHIDHPEWDPWMVSQSFVPSNVDKTQASGLSLGSSIPAQQWVTDNQPLLDKYGVAALWLMPQLTDSKYDPTIYNEQIAQGLRKKDTPDEFLKALYVNAGNNQYFDGLTVHEAALASIGKNAQAKNVEYNSWNSWVAQLEKQYPVWAEDHLSGIKQQNRTDAISNLTKMFDNGAAPAGQQTDDVKFLLEQYYTVAAEYQAAGQAQTYSQQLSEQKKVNDSWLQYLANLALEMPSLKPIIHGVFKEALVTKT